MKRAHLVFVLAVAAAVHLNGGTASAKVLTMQQGVERVLNGQRFQRGERVKIGRHGFVLVPLTVQKVANGVRVQGHFIHVIKGRDDKIHFVVEATKGQNPKGKITKIEYGGLFSRKVVKDVAEVLVGKDGGKIAIKIGRRVQRLLIGKWEPAAATIVGEIAKGAARRNGIK